MSGAPGRTVVVRLDALGDTLLSTPAVEYLAREVGKENLLILVSPGMGAIFGDEIAYREVTAEHTEHQIGKLIEEFDGRRVFVFSEKKRALRGAFRSGTSERIGFDPGWTQPLRSYEVRSLLTTRFPIVNSLDSKSRYHEVDRYCCLVAKGLSKKVVNGGSLKIFGLPRKPRTRFGTGPIGLQWTSKWLEGGWPCEFLVELLEQMSDDVVVFVPPDEGDWVQSVVPSYRHHLLLCCPDFREYARRVSECRCLLSVDTGAVHVAAAVGTAVIDVFPKNGAHHTVPRWRPWMTPHQVVLKPNYSEEAAEALLGELRQARARLDGILGWWNQVEPLQR